MAYYNLQDMEKGLEFSQKALSITEKSKSIDSIGLATSYNNIAVSYSNIGNEKKALEFNLKALNIYEKIEPKLVYLLSISYSNVGRSYRDIGDLEMGIKFGEKAIEVGATLNPKHEHLNLFYANLGITYLKFSWFLEAKAAFEKSESLKAGERCYRGWTMYYALLNDKTRSIECLRRSILLGFRDLKWLEAEPDLKNIREEKGYKDIVEQLKKH